ncbi:MAG: type II toxin-antitoxin system prevent-host-death family antitoxin, partial [Bryobacteraceae bacterium]
EAKTHLSALLERVAKGARITITKHGVPIAMLVPTADSGRRDREGVILQLEEFGRGRMLKGTSIRGLIEQGRRF